MLKKLPRMYEWILITLVLIAAIAWLKPENLTVSLYKLSLITMAAVAGYWIDRSLFPYARPDKVPQTVENVVVVAAAMLRRAIIVGCAMLAISLGI